MVFEFFEKKNETQYCKTQFCTIIIIEYAFCIRKSECERFAKMDFNRIKSCIS